MQHEPNMPARSTTVNEVQNSVANLALSKISIHIHIKFKLRANMITSSRQSKLTYALVYGVHRAIYIIAYV